MENFLAVMVVCAVIVFGALISVGNERQRRAIDGLREQAMQWAVQDLRIKRAELARDVRVDDPLAWLNRVVSKAIGREMELEIVEVSHQPPALVCAAPQENARLLITPQSPREIRSASRRSGGRLAQRGELDALLAVLAKAKAYELSVLNTGILFDLELQLAWKGLVNQATNHFDHLWLFVWVPK
jgi:hypothetical protein